MNKNHQPRPFPLVSSTSKLNVERWTPAASRAEPLNVRLHPQRPAFTLIEMLVATVLAAVLMFAVLTMLAGVSRDRKLLHSLTTSEPNPGIIDLLTWDLTNSRTITNTTDNQSITLTSLGSIDDATRTPNGRLVQITYEIQSKTLWRTQLYLDTPSRNANWRELIATNVSSISAVPSNRYLKLRIAIADGIINQNVWIK